MSFFSFLPILIQVALTKLLEEKVLIQAFAVGHNCAHDNIGMAVDVFGQGMEHRIGTQGQRALEDRGHESVVHNEDDVGIVGAQQLGDCLDVRNFQQGIRRGFHPNHLKEK
jgi:hypothetical protein